MQNLRHYHLTAVALLLFSMLFQSCQNDTFDPKGKWMVEDVKIEYTIQNTPPGVAESEIRAFIDVIFDGVIARIKKEGSVEFFKDKTYKSIFIDETEFGRYELQNDATVIETKAEGEKSYYTVDQSDASKVVLIGQLGETERKEISEQFTEGMLKEGLNLTFDFTRFEIRLVKSDL